MDIYGMFNPIYNQLKLIKNHRNRRTGLLASKKAARLRSSDRYIKKFCSLIVVNLSRTTPGELCSTSALDHRR